MSAPPRFAQRLLRWMLPREVHDSVAGDLFELFVERRAARGALSARAWYWRETASFVTRFTADRALEATRRIVGADSAPSALDFKLGGRMLVKYPGLAFIGGMGITLATAIGAGAFAWFNSYLYPELPLHEGNRVVAVVNWDANARNNDPRVLHDFVTWRRDATSLVDIGAFRTSRRNVVGDEGGGEPVTVAEMSAAGFRVARVAPLLGRFLLDADERPDAAPVVVIGHRVWETRFRGDQNIVGRTIRLGRVTHMIVGVMPDGFAFPVNHSFWIPLRADPLAYAIGEGPELSVFARLAPNATKESAQAELAAIGRRMAVAHPKTHANLQPRIVAYTEIFADMDGPAWLVLIIQSVIVLILAVVCANVAVLVYARTVTRTGEIAVRTALGATRRRVVSQLFAEAFVLSSVSALVGLGIAALALDYVDAFVIARMGGPPFWLEPGLSASTVFYTLGLAVLAAVIIGVLPALRATGSQLRTTLSKLSGGSKPQLGRTWTTLIVGQVAITVAALPMATLVGWRLYTDISQKAGFAVNEYLTAGTLLERNGNPVADIELTTESFIRALRTTQAELTQRLEMEPGVSGVTYANVAPGQEWPGYFEIAGVDSGATARVARVAPSFIDVFDMRMLAGRAFVPSDVGSIDRPVIVNRSFAQKTFGDGDIVGRRIRPWRRNRDDERPWSTIVGVVDDHPAPLREADVTKATLYEPTGTGVQGGMVIVRLQGTTPAAFSTRLREIAFAVDPELQLPRVQPLASIYDAQRREVMTLALSLVAGLGTVLLFSAAGIYSMMSFTVAQRRREIGVRSALGADPRRVLAGILSRAIRQLGMGSGSGLLFAITIDRVSGGAFLSGAGLVIVPAVVLFVLLVGLLAAAGPARSALKIQPTEALRAE